MIPPPRTHLVKWSGVFSPNSPVRSLVVLNPKAKKGFQFNEDENQFKRKNQTWSKMLAKVFKIDVLQCDHCNCKLRARAAVIDQDSITRYLKYIGVDYEAPARAPPKYKVNTLEFADECISTYE